MAYRRMTNRSEFEQVVSMGVTAESKHLEFKGGYGWQGPKKEEQAVELCRDVAQFANTDGGVLLLGVSETVGTDGQKVAGAIKPLADVDGMKNWVEQAIRNYLTPSTFSREMLALPTAAGMILAVNVEPSLHLVALWHKQLKVGIEYLYRTDHGKQWMNPDEVERHLMNASRATRLAVQQVKQEALSQGPVELVPAINTLNYDGSGALLTIAQGLRPVLGNIGERSVGLTVYSDESNQCVEVPYGVIRDAWVTTDGRPGLYLSVRLLQRLDGEISMEPIEQNLLVSD